MNRKGVILLSILLTFVLAITACSSATPAKAPANSNQATPTEKSQPKSDQPSEATAEQPLTPTEPPRVEPSPTIVPTNPPTSTPDTLYLGDTVEKGGYALTALKVEDPAKPGMFYSAKVGEKLVAVEIIVSNKSGDTLSVNPLNASLIDSNGYVYELELAAIDDQLAATDISTGEQVRGWVAFSIPEEAVPERIKYTESIFGGTVLSASLEQPPEGYVTTGNADGTSSPSSSTEPTTYLGDTVEFDGFGLSVIDVQDPAEPGLLYKPKADKKLVGVEVVVSAISGDDLSVNPLFLTLVDGDGFTYQPELAAVPHQIDSVTISPGERVRGWVGYEVPTEATVAAIKYAPDVWGDSFKVGATQPPADHTPVQSSFSPSLEGLPPLGEASEDSGYSLTATTVDDPAAPGMLYKSSQGTKLIGIEIVLANVSSNETLSVNPLYAYLVDNEGYVYGVELGSLKKGQIDTADLATGEKVKGWIGYVIPESATPASLKYIINEFYGSSLEVSLTQ